MTGVHIAIIISLILLIIYILYLLSKPKNSPIRNTIVYPILFILATIVILIGISNSNTNSLWINLPISFYRALRLMVIEFNIEPFESYFNLNLLFRIEYYVLYIAALLSFAYLILSILGIKIFNLSRRFVILFKKEQIFLVGYNDIALKYIDSLSKKEMKKTIFWLDNNSKDKDTIFQLNNKTIAFIEKEITEKNFTNYLNIKKTIRFISFYESDPEVYNFINTAKEFLRVDNVDNLCNTDIEFIVLANPCQNRFIRTMIASSKGSIRSFDKYEVIANKFVYENFFAKYMQNSIDEKTATVAVDTKIKVFMIGFGKVNRALIGKILTINQFASISNNKICAIPLDVNIYDNNKKIDSFDLNQTIFRYKKDNYMKDDTKSLYLDLPEDFSSIKLNYDISIGDADFMENLSKEIVIDKNSYNYFIVSFDTDFDNYFLAEKINEMLNDKVLVYEKEHPTVNNLKENYKVFVRTKEIVVSNSESIISFGNDKSILNSDYIINEKIYMKAKKRNLKYINLKKGTNDFSNTALRQNWNRIDSIKTESNVSSAVSIPSKLALLKFLDEKILKEEFDEKYYYVKNKNDYSDESLDKFNSNIKTTARDVLCYLEHMRWNAFYISSGYLPMSINEFINGIEIDETKVKFEDKIVIKNDNSIGKRHICLTTMAGIYKYQELVKEEVSMRLEEKNILAVNDSTNNNDIVSQVEKRVNVIKYDYQTLDNLYD